MKKDELLKRTTQNTERSSIQQPTKYKRTVIAIRSKHLFHLNPGAEALKRGARYTLFCASEAIQQFKAVAAKVEKEEKAYQKNQKRRKIGI